MNRDAHPLAERGVTVARAVREEVASPFVQREVRDRALLFLEEPHRNADVAREEQPGALRGQLDAANPREEVELAATRVEARDDLGELLLLLGRQLSAELGVDLARAFGR